ncbi:tetratricopeptide repeat protein [Erwinia sp. E602]|nr:tetratricopeptide repeat protein [Erwinia sp. E602]
MKKSTSGSALSTPPATDPAVAAQLRRAMEILSEKPQESLAIVTPLLKKNAHNSLVWVVASRTWEKLGKYFDAEEAVEKALTLTPDYSEALYAKANLLYVRERFDEAEIFLAEAIGRVNDDESRPLRTLRATILQKQKKYEQSIEEYTQLTREDPTNWRNWSNLGMIYQDLAEFDKMDAAYQQSCQLSSDNPSSWFNRIVGSHYNPAATPESILDICQQWQQVFRPSRTIKRAVAKNRTADKPLRIGMISEGFRSHPVGNMITLGLSHIPDSQIELYAYSTNHIEDHITYRIQRIAKKWQVIDGLSDNAVDGLIRDDEIDILFDLCGYNANSRMLTLQQQPAPLQIKWVGGLISSTGLEGMDYLLSDGIETPEGVDHLYSEKLIRLPGDYICYDPPHYLPPLSAGPVTENGYITFGCFNNAAKINDTLLEQWAIILNSVPDSRLFLKSFNFKNPTLCERVLSTLERHGVARERVLLEGSSPHRELLDSYNRVDIALDPWPYSGGLTTCEAMAMGVPVVTLPGPTFAGRHSASHLVNAGMPELVADSWQQYIDITVGITRDLTSLAVIRQHLRDILLASPVCDGQRFARHFSDAMRAIWQRYCEGKAPAALTLQEEGAPYFLDDGQPVTLQHPPVMESQKLTQPGQADTFEFQLSGKVLMMDYGGQFSRAAAFIDLVATDAVHAVIMDPVGVVEPQHLPLRKKSLQHIKLHLLGDGQEAPLYLCLDSRYSSDLPAIGGEQGDEAWAGQKVITELKVPSSRLDEINGLDRLEWFEISNTLNLQPVFEHGSRLLTGCLFVSVHYTFANTHAGQMSFSQLEAALAGYGFRFHSVAATEQGAALPLADGSTLASSQMVATRLLFVPTAERIAAMSVEQREKLAFILHAGYQLRDVAYQVLQVSSTARAEAYLGDFHDTAPPASSPAAVPAPVNIIPEMPRMSAAETALFERCITQSSAYYEFGSGGSTKLATRNNVTVYGVESDKFWVDTLAKEAGPLCKVDYVDIGPTKEWGYPVDASHQQQFPLYSEAILQHQRWFDLILVDGRFRVACTLNAIKHTLATRRNNAVTQIFIHDFWDRPDYHVVLEFLNVVDKAETAGVFTLKPQIDVVKLEKLLEKFKFIPA